MIRSVELATGVELECSEHGDPDGLPVLLLHGATDSRLSWEPLLPYLPASIRAIAPSQRGHGDSDRRPDAGYRIEDMADDAAALIEALEIAPAIVVGHSMGGWVAQQLAIEYPEHVRGLLLEAAFGSARDNPAAEGFLEEVAAMPDLPAEFAREFQLSTTANPLPDGALDLFVAESNKLPAWLWRELFGGFLEIDLLPRLGSIEAPTLLVWGNRDEFITRADQDRLLAALPNSLLEVYVGVGHAVHWEVPQRFAAELIAFAASFNPIPEGAIR
jgi:non-heme chloroperoxidase